MLQILDSLDAGLDGGAKDGDDAAGARPSRVRLRPLRRPDFEHLQRRGALGDDPVELVAGAVVRYGEADPDHDRVVAQAAAILRCAGGAELRVDVGAAWPLHDYAVVRPDLRVTTTRAHWDGTWRRSVLIVEVAGRTLAADRGLKRELYAQAQVDEYWLVDLAAGVIEAWRDRDLPTRWAPSERAPRGALMRHRGWPALALDLAALVPLPWERSRLQRAAGAATPRP